MSGGDGGNRTHLPNIGVRATMLDLEQASPVVGHLEATAVSGPVSSSPAVGEVPGQPVAPYTLSALVRKGSRPADKRPCAPSGSIQPLPRHPRPRCADAEATKGPTVLRVGRFRPMASIGVHVAIVPACPDTTNRRPGPDHGATSPPNWDRPIASQ